MILTTGQGAVKTDFIGSDQPIIQNLGPGTLYVGPSATNLLTTGLYLPVNAVYEYPATLVQGGAEVWLQADVDTCDVRIINVG